MGRVRKGLAAALVEDYDVGYNVHHDYGLFYGDVESIVLGMESENVSYHYHMNLGYCIVQVLMVRGEVSLVQ